ncbi:virulence associated lipoprotein [Borrelia hispanica]|uniref:virulence associated lipoprotein n=1 Tax=Borrelia hispanica TaxID=40835 RepID=UPI0004AC8CA7|nr:virulence associated lipoprotein [Borrelia hispanica]
MKQKVFIIFMLISLISLFLIACGQNGDNAGTQLNSEQEEKEKRERIETIKNATPSDVKKVLGYHNDANWKGEGTADFTNITAVFAKVPHRVANDGTEFLYNDTMSSDRAKESKAARREVYLALGYSNDFIWVFGGFTIKLIILDLVTKNKTKLKDFLIKIRKAAKAYYIDSYDTLEKKLSNLESLSLAEVKSLSIKLGELDTAQAKLVSNVVQPFREKYSLTEEYLANRNSKISSTITADEIETYWNTLSDKFYSSCNEIIRISGDIKGILDNI